MAITVQPFGDFILGELKDGPISVDDILNKAPTLRFRNSLHTALFRLAARHEILAIELGGECCAMLNPSLHGPDPRFMDQAEALALANRNAMLRGMANG